MQAGLAIAEFQPVLDFWFGAPGSRGYGASRKAWFRKSAAFDAQVRERFSGPHAIALAGNLQNWQETPQGLLALIILLDQFSRNMFRDTPAAFAGDPMALAAARLMIAHGWDAQLAPVMRSFVYLPFEHAEDLGAQEEALRLFATLPAGAERDEVLEWARKHHEVIRRFGRFPHRNAILGRPSTLEEVAFLKQPGSRF
jgi:uncharacterized protein (DUF924 family)